MLRDDDFEYVATDASAAPAMPVFTPTLRSMRGADDGRARALEEFARDLGRCESRFVEKLTAKITYETLDDAHFTLIYPQDYVPKLDAYTVRDQRHITDARDEAVRSAHAKIKNFIASRGYEYRDEGIYIKVFLSKI